MAGLSLPPLRQRMPTMPVIAFLVWAAVVYGTTLAITGSKLTLKWRRFLKPLANNALPIGPENRPLPVGAIRGFFGTLFECPMCMGFWVGALYSLGGLRLSVSLLDGACLFDRAMGAHRFFFSAALDGFASL